MFPRSTWCLHNLIIFTTCICLHSLPVLLPASFVAVPVRSWVLLPLSRDLCWFCVFPTCVLYYRKSPLSALLDFSSCILDVSVVTVENVSHFPTKLGDALIAIYRRSLDMICYRPISFSHLVPWHFCVMPSLKSLPCGLWHIASKISFWETDDKTRLPSESWSLWVGVFTTPSIISSLASLFLLVV